MVGIDLSNVPGVAFFCSYIVSCFPHFWPRKAEKAPPPQAAGSPADTAAGVSRLGLGWPGVRACEGHIRVITHEHQWIRKHYGTGNAGVPYIDMFVSQRGSISAIFWVL